MISKKYRLTERETKRVLHKWRPFFSYHIVLNYMPNKVWYSRFSIVIWSKSVNNNVERNFFRRKFFDMVFSHINRDKNYDMVFVLKKQIKFDKKNIGSILSFEKDLNFLLNKI